MRVGFRLSFLSVSAHSIIGFTLALQFAMLASPASAAVDVLQILPKTYWGETSETLLRHFRSVAMRLPRSFDFGDSYSDVVLDNATVGGVPVVVFFQMDKVTHGLKRIQLERPQHGANPPAFRGILAALHAAYGEPDEMCFLPVHPIGGYQAAEQELWVRGTDTISAIYRDTTLQAFEGCPFGITSGKCGLTGQQLVRISPGIDAAAPDPCALGRRYGWPVAPAPESK
jgi:hypothetical protein